MGHKKTSMVHSIFQGMQSIGEKEKRSKKQHKKNKRTQDQPVVGLSEIFYPDFANNSNPDLDLHDEYAPDETAQHLSPDKMASLYHSAIECPEQNISVISTAGRGPKSKKPTSSSKSRRTKKSLHLEKTKDTTLGVRTASGSGVNGHLRKSSLQNPLMSQKKSSLNPSKQISVPLPAEKAKTEAGRGADRYNSSTQPRLVSRGQPSGEKSRWLEQKHPDQKEKLQSHMSQIPTQSDFHQTTPLAFGQLELKKEKAHKSAETRTAEARKSQKGSGKIRRIHELVSLYRCKFKPNVSDASIIGTLHSAASVIQIHFRYRKHLREAQNVLPTTEGS